MIEPKLRCDRKRPSFVPSLYRRQKNLLFHPDVPEQAGSKVIVRFLHHVVRGSKGCLKKVL